MTTTTALPAYSRPQRVTQARVMKSEWTKLRTQPAALWSLLSAAVLLVAFGIGYSLHAGMVVVADGSPEAAVRLQRVLTSDPGTGVLRHVDAGYDEAIRCAKDRGVVVPGL